MTEKKYTGRYPWGWSWDCDETNSECYKIVDLKEMISRKDCSIELLNKENAQLEKKIDTLEGILKSKDEKIEELGKIIDEKDKTFIDQSILDINLACAAKKLKKQNEELSNEIGVLKDEIEDLKRDLRYKDGIINEFCEADKNSLIEFREFKNKISKLEDQQFIMDNLNADLQKKLAMKETENAALDKLNKSVNELNSKLLRKINDRDRQIKELNRILVNQCDLKSENSKLKKEVKDLENKLKCTNANYESAVNEIKYLKHENEVMKKSVAGMDSAIKKLLDKNDGLCCDKMSLESDVHNLESQCKKKDEQIQLLNDNCARLEDVVEDLKSTNEHLRNRIKKLNNNKEEEGYEF